MKKIVITGGLGYVGTQLCKLHIPETLENEINGLDLSSLRFGRSASAALAPEIHKRFEEKFKTIMRRNTKASCKEFFIKVCKI